ncbi:MAG: hypothetical protein HYX26_05575 [Acidobacteriales bacterium]|nr:hypothetical protein [Terriglobales bacterium]
MSKRTIDLPVDHWLKAGESKDFKSSVAIEGPYLHYQQRFLVRVQTKVDLKRLQKAGVERDLHSIVKVADENGRWDPGESYVSAQFTERLKDSTDLLITTELFFQPGRYTLGVIVYDGLTEQRSVSFRKLKVDPINNDPLPHLARDLPRVEFLPEAREDALPFGEGRAYLPVTTARPVLIDLVADFGAYSERLPPRQQNFDASRIVQAASLLSQIQLDHGCIRVTGLDILRRQEIFRRADAAGLDWEAKREEILKRPLHTVDINELAARLESAAYVRKQLERLWSEPVFCPDRHGPVQHIVIFLGHGVFFPQGTKVAPAQIDRNCDCSIYYLRLEPNYRYLFDMVPKILKPISPRIFKSESPKDFRKDLAELLRAIGTAPVQH